MEQPVEDRNKSIYKKHLCYGCLEGILKKHNAKSCSNRRQCKVCNGWHPTILHWIKIEKNKSKKGTGVVLRFREEPMAVTDDIEAKYHQVNIPVEQRASYNFFGGRTVILKMKL